VFSDLGFTQAKIGDITREAGISRTLLYHYFSSKEEIFEALLLEALERMETMARNLRERDGTVEEQIRYLVDSYHEAMLAQPGLAKLLVDSMAAKRRPPTPRYQKRLRALRKSAVEWVESLGPDVRTSIPPEEFLLVGLGALLAWFSPTPFAEALGARPGTRGKALKRHKDAVVAILLHGIEAPPDARRLPPDGQREPATRETREVRP
jgi:AcrR family transcriptional regulator